MKTLHDKRDIKKISHLYRLYDDEIETHSTTNNTESTQPESTEVRSERERN